MLSHLRLLASNFDISYVESLFSSYSFPAAALNEAELCISCLPWHWGALQASAQLCPGGKFTINFLMMFHLVPNSWCILYLLNSAFKVNYFFLQGLKSVDSSVKKEGDLPAADPSTPIPLKYEDESTSGGPECLEKQMALFLDKSKLYCCANKTFPVPTQTAVTLFWLSKRCTCTSLMTLLHKQK